MSERTNSVRHFLSFFFILIILPLCLCSITQAAEREDFIGAWLNDNQVDPGMTRILISAGAGSDLVLHAYGQCVPIECDWGETTALYTGNPFSAVYDFSYKTVYMDVELLSPTSLYIHSFHDYDPGDPRPDTTTDEYFTLMTQPDLVIRRYDLPSTILPYGQYNWITFYVQNLGAPGVAGPLRAKIVNRQRNGVDIPTEGYFELTYTSPIDTGQEVSHDFAVGQDTNWIGADYWFQIEVDYDNLIPEEIETNNLSPGFFFTIIDEHDVSGICRYNGYTMAYQTEETPSFYITTGGLPIEEAEAYYYNVTGRYAVDNIPEDQTVDISVSYHLTGSHPTLPGNFRGSESVLLSSLTLEEREAVDIDCYKIIHMTRPFDNSQLINYTPYPDHQPGIVFEWEAVTGAVEYLFAIDKYRDSTHPSGYGHISREVEIYSPDTSQTVILPLSDPNEHYEALIIAINGTGQWIGHMMTTYTNGGYSWDYRFKVDYNCYPDLPAPQIYVTDKQTYEVGGIWYDRYYITTTNADQFPDELFEPAPDLPACGLNDEASRTYIYMYDQDDVQISSFCALYSPESLNFINFVRPAGNPPPDAVYMVLEDRRCEIDYRSNYANPLKPCPVGDLNGDCIVDIIDFCWMAQNWLKEGTP